MRIIPVRNDRNQNKSNVVKIPFGRWNYLKLAHLNGYTQAQHDLVDEVAKVIKPQLINRGEKMMTRFYPATNDEVVADTTIEGINSYSCSFFKVGDDVVAMIEQGLNSLLAAAGKESVKLSKIE